MTPFLLTLLACAVAVPAASEARGFKKRLPAPVTDQAYRDDGRPDAPKVELGRLLFFDKILSGNENIACATCHHPLAATGDGLSLSLGEGGRGLGVTRDAGLGPDAVLDRVPRNAPALFNLGAREFARLFHDGRVEVDPSAPAGVRSPAGTDLPDGLESVLAVQAMFPVTAAAEMAGQAGENPIADAAAAGDLAGPGGVWEQLAARLRSVPPYVERFVAVYDDVADPSDLTFVHAANAIAAFQAAAWRADDSPFDRYLRGDKKALSKTALKGMKLFYGKAGCDGCHAGPFQTDHDFHAIAMPQIGPGKGDGPDGQDDFGRERTTGDPADRVRFRTPPLRQVAITAPYGHDGAYDSLEAVVRHHLDPVAGLAAWERTQVVLPPRPDLDARDFLVQDDPGRVSAIAAANELEPVSLSDKQVGQLLEFLHALTDRGQVDLRRDVPFSVPSGLPVFD